MLTCNGHGYCKDVVQNYHEDDQHNSFQAVDINFTLFREQLQAADSPGE